MTEEKKGRMNKTSGQQTDQTKIVWDDSNMRSVYSNATNVAGGREEIVLLFGMNQAWYAGQKEVKIHLSDRIVLSPFAAKRLSLLLNKVLKDYEQRYGTMDIAGTQVPPQMLKQSGG